MIKKLVLVFIALFAIQSYAQNGTSSPYSFYGIGSLNFKGSVENRSMGGLGVYKDSIHINFQNPATYAGNNLASFNNESRPVKFAVAGSGTATSLKANTTSDKSKSANFDYLGLSIPLGKFGFGFGIQPYSSVGYKLETNNDSDDLENRYEGEGGLNKVFLSFGYQIDSSLSIGLQADYNFGNIENNTVNIRYNEDNLPLQYQTKEYNKSELSGVNFNLGLHYQKMISDKLELQTSLTYTPKTELTSKNLRTFSTIYVGETSDSDIIFNQLDGNLEASNLQETNLTLPSKFSIGAGLGQPRKWFAGIEYTTQNTSEFYNPLYDNVGATFEDASKLSIGGFFIPEYNSFSKYWKRMTYRAGLRFENTGLNINNESIKEFGMSFGVGVPVGNVFSNANIGLEFGQKGTLNANLVKENFVSFQVSLSLNDRWFIKKKYN
ncbi:hypothetical protein DZC78_12385 [Olleya aquimaris]|uniref:Long-subunit fatty acid transport protein n=1 Tax=Olleya sediminilitoris TaxID=2795739 RepID=A0ABS1WIW4_9FLAO|nr:hypothetical protein [Olleya sediminilitoris]AXO81148.1 hypothetical protein DZC78_12385 [Olleya aquimaris]MBL7559068.1 hypothetical protein [Olleya sediminilitoris]